MVRISDTKLYVGAITDQHIGAGNSDWAVVHATQSVHYPLMGWDRKLNKPPRNHAHYIIYAQDDRLSLNWVDGAAHLYEWSGTETFIRVLDFMDKWYPTKNILVHCDQGQSRAPTVALLYLAKRLKNIPADSFEEARRAFITQYPHYAPSGIANYVAANWRTIH